jgi:hypothetical protein
LEEAFSMLSVLGLYKEKWLEGTQFSSERMLHKDYDLKGSVEKISGYEPQGAWRQDQLISGKQPVVK